MELLKMIKELQAVLMVGDQLPHAVSIRLLARLDEAERHLSIAPKAVEVELVEMEGEVLIEPPLAPPLEGGEVGGEDEDND